ncbi:MAG TPA: hypothetical protein VF252_02440 [Gemmatimonadales bacterium]
MDSPRIPRLLPCALIALTVACADSVDPGGSAATYVLHRIDQDPLPAEFFSSQGYAYYIFADTIRFLGLDRGTISQVMELRPLRLGLPGEGPMHTTHNFRFTNVGDEVAIEYECPPNAHCIPGPHLVARRVVGGLIARSGPRMLGRAPLVYTQVQDGF